MSDIKLWPEQREVIWEAVDSEAVAVAASTLRVLRAMECVDQLTNNEREKFLEAFGGRFCRHCGSDDLPCYCTRDE